MRKWSFVYDFSQDEKTQEDKIIRSKNLALLLQFLGDPEAIHSYLIEFILPK